MFARKKKKVKEKESAVELPLIPAEKKKPKPRPKPTPEPTPSPEGNPEYDPAIDPESAPSTPPEPEPEVPLPPNDLVYLRQKLTVFRQNLGSSAKQKHLAVVNLIDNYRKGFLTMDMLLTALRALPVSPEPSLEYVERQCISKLVAGESYGFLEASCPASWDGGGISVLVDAKQLVRKLEKSLGECTAPNWQKLLNLVTELELRVKNSIGD